MGLEKTLALAAGLGSESRRVCSLGNPTGSNRGFWAGQLPLE